MELVGLGFDTMTLRIDRPPASAGEALEFALETYVYCPDSVDQGLETIDRFATVLRGPLITLWWD